MADSQWTTALTPVFAEAVSLLADHMILAELVDRLFSRNMLTAHEYQQLIELRPFHDEDAARRLLFCMMSKPSPSYDMFCDVLYSVRGGGNLLRLMSDASCLAAYGERNISINYAYRYYRSVDESIYEEARASGSVPINRYRVMVVGQDGAGKSCLIDSFLDRQFKPRNPSTDGIAIHVAVTAAEGKAGQHTWHKEEYDKAHLDKYLAAGYVITKKQRQETAYKTMRRIVSLPSYEIPLPKRKKLHLWQSPDEPQSDEDANELDQHIEEITKDEKLTPEQHRMITEYLQSSEALASLENFEVSSKLLWDLGGQERYLTSHAALMPTESEYTVCLYLLVIDISKPLGDKAESSYRLGGTSADVPLELANILYNRDFPRHWFTSIGISHPSDMSPPYLGEDLKGVSYPAVLIAATHTDKVAKMPNCEEFLKSQNAELDNLISDLRCEDHIVKNPKNGQWFFRVDNTKSGQTEDSERCEGVKTISSILDNSSKHYWSQKNEKRPMPVAWVRFELFLVSWKMGKIISVRTATKLASRVGIKSKEETLLALKFLHNLGVIFYFWDVSELANCIIVDPTWLISTVAAFVTAKEPTKVMYKRRWRKLCETGKFSRDMVRRMLTEAKVESRDQEPVLDVLRMLDILCDPPEASSSTFFIPCMLSRKPTGSSKWEKYSPSEAFPPPIVIYPNEVQTIPEALFLRIVTKCTRKFSEECELTRNCCLFRIGNNLVLELLHYNRGACLIVSLTGEGDVEEAMSSAPDRAPKIQQFLIDSVRNAKKRGMSGLELKFYHQVSECIRIATSESDEGAGSLSCQPPDDDGLVKLTESCKWPVSVVYKSGKYATKEHLKLVRRWHQEQNLTAESQDSREVLERKPTSEELINLSKEISSVWKVIARRLSIPDSAISEIEMNVPTDIREQAYQSLQIWEQQESSSASLETLCRALCIEGKKAVAARVFNIIDEALRGFDSLQM